MGFICTSNCGMHAYRCCFPKIHSLVKLLCVGIDPLRDVFEERWKKKISQCILNENNKKWFSCHSSDCTLSHVINLLMEKNVACTLHENLHSQSGLFYFALGCNIKILWSLVVTRKKWKCLMILVNIDHRVKKLPNSSVGKLEIPRWGTRITNFSHPLLNISACCNWDITACCNC